MQDSVAALRLLLDAKAAVDRASVSGGALTLAAQNRNGEAVALWLARGADAR